MVAADGRTVWIRESGTVLVELGRPVAMRGIFQDVTRQKLDAEQLDKLNRQLMGTSRLAGMAEVATGVLHNVGNVLNSVSVSATLVADRLRLSNVTNLRRATALLREKSGSLAEFLTTDPKGKLIPEYLATVADQLAGEQARLIAQMESVGEHIEHIKEIVAMQQNYAKVLGVVEKGKKVFGRRPAFEEFASRQDLKEQDQLLKHEMRLLGARLEQQIGDAEVSHSRGIGALHEKINKVAEDTAYLRGKIEERLL
jgi:hypothetical protein